MQIRSAALLAVFFTLVAVHSLASAKAPAAPLELGDGDSFVFLGDSITHQCLYTQYIEDFFYTRYPDRRIHFHNAGVSGDRAGHALDRFEDDVAAFKPKYVSVLLGMNDGEYDDFNQELFADYEERMLAIVAKISASGARPILMTPTMFDHHQLAVLMKDPDSYRFSDRTFSGYYNSVLAFYGAWARERAVEQQLPFVNLWAPLNDLTVEGRRADPDFTLIPDAFHPAPSGQFVMAFSFVSQLSPDRRSVSSISFTRGGDQWRAGVAGTGTISDIEGDAEHLSFTFVARALPWVVPVDAIDIEGGMKWATEPAASVGYEMTRAGHKMSNERLKVAGLAPGSYEVTIDGQSIGKPVSHVKLGTKIELQSNSNTPQYQQAMEVALLNRARNDEAIRPLRGLWSRVKGMRGKFAEEPEKFDEAYSEIRPQIAEKLALAEEFEEKIYAANQPLPRKYVIRKVK